MPHSRRSGSISLTLFSICALLGVAYGYTGIEQAWLGIKSWEQCGFWETIDPAFHTELTRNFGDIILNCS